MHFEKTLSSKDIYKGKIISLKKDKVELENGATAEREVFMHPGAVAIVAVDTRKYVYLVKQYRYPIAEELIEIPAGKLDKGETPFECAKRELKEETGLTAKRYKNLGVIYPSPAYCDEKIHLFLALDLSEGEQKLDEDEFLSVKKLPLNVACEMAVNGDITDAKTVAGLLKAKLALGII